MAVGADGTSYALWEDSRNGNADIFFSSYTAGGSAWAANTKISDDAADDRGPSLLYSNDAAGRTVLDVAWRPLHGPW